MLGKKYTKFITALRKLLVSDRNCTLFLLPKSSLSYFQNLKHPSSVLQNPTPISFSELTLGNSLSLWLKPQYKQHVIKFIAIYCYSTVNQVSEARNIIVPSVTAKSFKMQCYLLFHNAEHEESLP